MLMRRSAAGLPGIGFLPACDSIPGLSDARLLDHNVGFRRRGHFPTTISPQFIDRQSRSSHLQPETRNRLTARKASMSNIRPVQLAPTQFRIYLGFGANAI